MRTVEQLERDLQGDGVSVLDPARLDRIRRGGRRSRRRRHAAIGVGALVAALTVGGLVAGGQQGVAREQPSAGERQEPRELSDLARRALREIPGAERVSPWQVVIPGPGVPEAHGLEIATDRIVGGPVETGAHTYLGPTAFDRALFPRWLYDGVQEVEETDLASRDGSYPVGSTEPGILVDYGPAQLACVLPRPGNGEFDDDVCRATLVTMVGDRAYLNWSMGTERFLQPGAPMEVFLSPDYSTGQPTHLALAGLHGTEVSRVDYVSADGTVTRGSVLPGSLLQGDTMMFANVPGELASVIAYDDAGEVVDNHRLTPCGTPEDCEVR